MTTKVFSSSQPGAPVLSGVAGSLIAILDAVLVNGWGAQAVSSIVVSGGIATVSFANPHSSMVNGTILIAGATPAALNGEKRVLTSGAQTLTFSAPGVADGNASGSITSKVAPLGWVKLFSGTNQAAYKSTVPESTGCVLAVTDTLAGGATVTGYEAMTSVSAGTGRFPTAGQAPTFVWSKSDSTDASSRAWRIIGDERGFYFSCVPNASALRASQTMYFGDIQSVKSNDPYACAITGSLAYQNAVTDFASSSVEFADGAFANTSVFLARAANTLGGSQPVFKEASIMTFTSYRSGQGSLAYAYPSPVNNGLVLTRMRVASSPQGVRGYLPGVYLSPQAIGTSLSTDEIVNGSGELAGTKLLTIGTGTGTFATSGAVFFDITNDWR
ncbi:hypothetical protein [Curvibacter phage PCA1]|nr:hypothetical protein [Curvibacter phage PCA1]